jgi:hypothetical protein
MLTFFKVFLETVLVATRHVTMRLCLMHMHVDQHLVTMFALDFPS